MYRRQKHFSARRKSCVDAVIYSLRNSFSCRIGSNGAEQIVGFRTHFLLIYILIFEKLVHLYERFQRLCFLEDLTEMKDSEEKLILVSVFFFFFPCFEVVDDEYT